MVLPQAMAWVQYWFRVLSLKFCRKSKKNCGDISPQSPAFCMYVWQFLTIFNVWLTRPDWYHHDVCTVIDDDDFGDFLIGSFWSLVQIRSDQPFTGQSGMHFGQGCHHHHCQHQQYYGQHPHHHHHKNIIVIVFVSMSHIHHLFYIYCDLHIHP